MSEGTAELPFEVVSDVEVDRWDRYRERFDEYVRAPLGIVAGDYRALIGGAIVLFFAFITVFGPLIVDPVRINVETGLVTPFETMTHPLGTDSLGRDMISQMVYASRPMMEMVLVGAIFATTVGTAVGLVAGYKGGTIDTILSMVSDIALTIPGLPLTIVLMLLIETTDPAAVGLILTINMWGGTARQVRSEVLKLRSESYVEASRVMGLSTGYIATRDLLPNIMPFVFMRGMRMTRSVIFASVGLYFLGVLPFSVPNWGVIMQRAWEQNAVFQPDLYHVLFIPMFTIVIFAYGVTLLAQSADKIFNPRIRAKHAEHSE